MAFLDRFTGSSREGFATQVLKVARRLPGIDDARYDAERFAIALWRGGSREPVWIFLSNVYRECRGASRAERRERVERLLRVMAEPDDAGTWESVRPRLRPVLRPVTFGQVGMTGMVPPLSRPALPYLREMVVVDRPDSMAYVTQERLVPWGVSADEVFAAARENLARIAERFAEDDEPAGNGIVRMVDSGDGYWTSLVLAPGWLAGVSERAGRPMVAFVPDNNTVVLAPVPDAGLDKLYEIVEQEYREAARSLSPVGYVAGPRGTVAAYAPPEGHPDHLAARRAEVVLAATEYDAQTQWLSEQYEQAGMDVYVARLIAAERPGEPAITIATWTDGISSLLPEAQFISFTGDGAVALHVPWQAVAEQVDLRPEPLLAPARYRVGGWPPPDVMEALRAHAVD